MKRKINVLKTDIMRGKRMATRECPIALAIMREGLQGVKVGFDSCEAIGFEEFKLPREARRFVKRFDAGENRADLKPFSFVVNMEKRS